VNLTLKAKVIGVLYLMFALLGFILLGVLKKSIVLIDILGKFNEIVYVM